MVKDKSSSIKISKKYISVLNYFKRDVYYYFFDIYLLEHNIVIVFCYHRDSNLKILIHQFLLLSLEYGLKDDKSYN